ncbi:M15 family metallopeptidase [Brevibacterium spongiae]|uniref:M15 family metallopeptidase n=1 Tax=Brevibacterium spongiae TaxID=2909672 RepID=A0ABY5SN79_9MICO|nr:M15 family metallopeptidase [Brevibacterium spongiae]UVI35932.1 M15 family metallopeptidase [Brevibacterium spongiae]
MSEPSSTAEPQVRRRDLHRRRSTPFTRARAAKATASASDASTHTASVPADRNESSAGLTAAATPSSSAASSSSHTTPASAPLPTRREAMAAEAQATGVSPRRAAMARETAAARSTSTFGSPAGQTPRRISAGAAESRGSDGALLKSVRKRKLRTASTLAAVSVAGAATAVTMLVNNLGGGAEVKTDPNAAGEPAAISPEKVNADVPESKGKSSIEIGAPSAKQKNVEAASRAIEKSALPGCDAKQNFNQSAGNGELPEEWLCDLGKEDHRLRADAAVSFAKMNAAYKKDTGKELEITDSYRDMAGQVSVAGRKPGLAAKPGTSLHGWGIALDLGGGVEAKSGAWSWLVEHGDEYGWENPDWAKASMYEPWHWEYKPARSSIKGN